MIKRLVVACLLVLSTLSAPALAIAPDEVLDDPALEQRARDLSAELRCMVCQNQSIDDSDAPLAKDLRVLVRERLLEGDTNQQVIDYLVSRYGEFVLLKPRFGAHTLLLWAAAPLALIAGITAIFFALRRRNASGAGVAPGTVPLTKDEQDRLDILLSEKSDTR
ncbi:cytochrome c-type biogenesis protein [Roseibium sp. RKSG952]|uniref:cytochrome c-type biogenesis protein n=1 Tax=Roseibium sp. RKSG952 TaxID=2529384 RepID=UPI0012BC5766|nr:cytochrome c-type biogenesis protein [Roseibium sp. RKSG952]MTH98938.1 cytochrome c-type biogenesis protein CcmH [Roseibium sp. RKSG952]